MEIMLVPLINCLRKRSLEKKKKKKTTSATITHTQTHSKNAHLCKHTQ